MPETEDEADDPTPPCPTCGSTMTYWERTAAIEGDEFSAPASREARCPSCDAK